MQFRQLNNFPNARYDGENYKRCYATIREHWRTLGWEEIPEGFMGDRLAAHLVLL